MLQLDKIVHSKRALESKISQIKQIEWDTYFNCYAEACKRLQDSKRASLRDILRKANEKLKPQEAPNTNDCKTDVTPPPL